MNALRDRSIIEPGEAAMPCLSKVIRRVNILRGWHLVKCVNPAH